MMAEHATHIEAWVGERELHVSEQKSTVTFFTPETRQGSVHPLIPLGGSPLRLEAYPMILDVTFDTYLYFYKHVEATEEKAEKKLPILKALACTT